MNISRLGSFFLFGGSIKKVGNWLLPPWRRAMDLEAKHQISLGNYRNALAVYDRLLSLDNTDDAKFEVLLGKAESLIHLDKFREAVKCYKNASELSDLEESHILSFVDGLLKKLAESLQSGDGEEHEEQVQVQCHVCDGITINPTTLPCGHTICQNCISKLEDKSCKECNDPFCTYKVKVNVVLQEIVKKYFANDIRASCIRLDGNALLKEGKTYKALEKYTEAYQLHPTEPLLCSNLSHALTLLGRFEEGLQHAKRVCELRPTWPKGYYRKGCALIGLGNDSEAVFAFFKCLTKDPTNKWTKKSVVKVMHKLFVHHSCAICTDNGLQGESQDKCDLMQVIHLVESELEEKESKDVSLESEEKIPKTFSVQDFECTLCCRLFYEPVTTPCGHVFCRSCLDRTLDHRPGCPICRSSLSQVLATRNQNITVAIEKLMKVHLPEEYKERKIYHLEEMQKLASVASNTADEIPIFVCTLAFPSMPCPLHIYEPRYRLMVRQCMESGSNQFGMCLYDEQNGFSEYGTMLEVSDVQFLSDGRSSLNAVGGRRFKVLSKGKRDGYSVARVEWISDDLATREEEAELNGLMREVYVKTKRWYNALPLLVQRRISNSVSDIPAWEEDADRTPHGPQWLWWLIAICPLDPKTQVAMLGLTSLKERLLKMRILLIAI